MPYLVKRHGEVLATLEPFDSDNYWWECRITTTAKFAIIEDRVRRASNTEDLDLYDQIWNEIYDMDVVLVHDDEDNIVLNSFFINLYDDGTAHMKY